MNDDKNSKAHALVMGILDRYSDSVMGENSELYRMIGEVKVVMATLEPKMMHPIIASFEVTMLAHTFNIMGDVFETVPRYEVDQLRSHDYMVIMGLCLDIISTRIVGLTSMDDTEEILKASLSLLQSMITSALDMGTVQTGSLTDVVYALTRANINACLEGRRKMKEEQEQTPDDKDHPDQNAPTTSTRQ